MSKKAISLLKESTLKVELDIQGTTETPQVRLNMGLGEGMSFSLPGIIQEGTAVIKFPELSFIQEKFPDLEYVPARLEVFIENQFFIPWEDELEIKKEIRVKANESFETEVKKDPIITIKPKKTSANKDTLIIDEREKVSDKLSKARLAMEKRLK